MKYSTLSKKPTRFMLYTGLNVADFDKLANKLEPLWQEAEIQRLSRPNRQRKIGGGKKYKLISFNDKLLLVLVFYKLYLTFDLLGYLFGYEDKAPVCRLIHRLETILLKELGLPKIRRRSGKKISTIDELLKLHPEIEEYLIDATEQQIPRPKDKRKRKKFYSGKKKKHTIKTQIIAERNSGLILQLSSSVAGSIHDYKLFQQTKLSKRLPDKIPIHLDKGYEGIKKDFPRLNIFIPKKANRWHKLIRKDKVLNKKLNKIRVKIEHAINKCKKFKILDQTYRHSLKDYNKRFEAIAGLINFKLFNKELSLATI